MIPRVDKAALKASLDLVAIIRATVPGLKARGRQWTGLCPFHADTRPSLDVNPDKQLWVCRACGAGGDAIRFMALRDKVSDASILRRLSGGDVPRLPPPAPLTPDTPVAEVPEADLPWVRAQRKAQFDELVLRLQASTQRCASVARRFHVKAAIGAAKPITRIEGGVYGESTDSGTATKAAGDSQGERRGAASAVGKVRHRLVDGAGFPAGSRDSGPIAVGSSLVLGDQGAGDGGIQAQAGPTWRSGSARGPQPEAVNLDALRDADWDLLAAAYRERDVVSADITAFWDEPGFLSLVDFLTAMQFSQEGDLASITDAEMAVHLCRRPGIDAAYDRGDAEWLEFAAPLPRSVTALLRPPREITSGDIAQVMAWRWAIGLGEGAIIRGVKE